MTDYSKALLHTVEAFIETNPEVPEDVPMSVGDTTPFTQDENDGRPGHKLIVTIDGSDYLVSARKIP